MQTSQKVVQIQEKDWILNECQKVKGLWITERGCQIARNEAELYCGMFKTLQQIESLSGLSRFVESNKLRKIFLCGDCPKYGAPCTNFEDVLSYIVEVQAAVASMVVSLDIGEHAPEDVAEMPGELQSVSQDEIEVSGKEDKEAPILEDDSL